jgi:hypothetical protein
MHANVPQFIDVEDKIAFGLTAKQLLWMFGMGAILLVFYNILDRQSFFAVGVPVVIIFAGLAFFRPQGVSLLTFSGYALRFLMRPKNYVWKRIYSSPTVDLKKAALIQRGKMTPVAPVKKLPSAGQLKKIAWTLDTRK